VPDFFFLKKFDRRQRYALTFLVEKASASFALSYAPNESLRFIEKIENFNILSGICQEKL